MPKYVKVLVGNVRGQLGEEIIDTTKINRIVPREGYYDVQLNNRWVYVLPENMEPIWNAIGIRL